MEDFDTIFPEDLQIIDEYEFEYECGEFKYGADDIYLDIREQVLQLTAEEDPDFDEEETRRNNSSNSLSAKHGPIQPKGGYYYNWPEKKDEEHAPPPWIVNLWRFGNGTGVFIPQVAPSRRRNRSRRRKGQKKKNEEESEKAIKDVEFCSSRNLKYVHNSSFCINA